jgi:hypothetical protein
MNSGLCSLPGEKVLAMSREDVNELSSQHPDVDGDVEQTGLIIWNYYKIDGFRISEQKGRSQKYYMHLLQCCFHWVLSSLCSYSW